MTLMGSETSSDESVVIGVLKTALSTGAAVATSAHRIAISRSFKSGLLLSSCKMASRKASA